MTNYKISLALLAMAMCVDSFTVSPSMARSTAQLSTSTANDFFFMDETTSDQPVVAMTDSIQPAEPSSPKNEKKMAPKKVAAHGSTGVLAPVVTTMKSVVGEEELNKLRGKVIAMHSDVIKSFVDTADSPLGQTVLKTMFVVADVDKNGTLEEIELKNALKTLGFRFLNEKQIHGIFERADVDKNGRIDLDEWMREAPKTLRTNLVKLAKQNGGDLGLLA
jgi:EF hand